MTKPHPSTPTLGHLVGNGDWPDEPAPTPIPGLPEPEGNVHLLFPLDLGASLQPNEQEPKVECGMCRGKGTVSLGAGSPWTNAKDCDHCDGTGYEQYIRSYVRDADGHIWQVMDGGEWNEVCVSIKPIGKYADILVSLHKRGEDGDGFEAIVYNNRYEDNEEHVLYAPTEADVLAQAVRYVERRSP